MNDNCSHGRWEESGHRDLVIIDQRFITSLGQQQRHRQGIGKPILELPRAHCDPELLRLRPWLTSRSSLALAKPESLKTSTWVWVRSKRFFLVMFRNEDDILRTNPARDRLFVSFFSTRYIQIYV